MKKIFFGAVALTAVALTACNGSNVKADLQDSMDSTTYYLGINQASSYVQRGLFASEDGVDSTCIDEFLRGFKEAALNDEDKKQKAYVIGYQLGLNLPALQKDFSNFVFDGDSTKLVSLNNLIAGFVEGFTTKDDSLRQMASTEFNKSLEAIQTKKLEAQYGDYKKEQEKWLADNKKKEGVVTLPSGLQYKVITEGTGALPTDTSVVKCNYKGTLTDGTQFDSSYDRGEAFEVNLAQPSVIQGWIEVLKLMPAGSKWEVYVPQELAYGAQDRGTIKPFSTLIFTIETLQ